jgi:hypothetical protein
MIVPSWAGREDACDMFLLQRENHSRRGINGDDDETYADRCGHELPSSPPLANGSGACDTWREWADLTH